MRITKDALKMLAMNNASCKVFGEKKVLNLKYLTECAKKGEDFDYDELVRRLPEKGNMYGSIKSIAKTLNKDVIDLEVMFKFLGGQWHIQYVKEQNDLSGLRNAYGNVFADKYLFAHILVVATLTSVDECICAMYQSEKNEVEVKNLIVHPFVLKPLSVGQKVLIHQGLVLEADPSDEKVQLLTAEQGQSKDFQEVIEKVKCIDYIHFWNIKKWTQEVIEQL